MLESTHRHVIHCQNVHTGAFTVKINTEMHLLLDCTLKYIYSVFYIFSPAFSFCGPLTTVKIYTEKTMPRVKLETISKQPSKNKKKGSKQQEKTKVKPEEVGTKAGAARVMARRFSELVLLEVSKVSVNMKFVIIQLLSFQSNQSLTPVFCQIEKLAVSYCHLKRDCLPGSKPCSIILIEPL